MMEQMKWKVDGMDCASCAASITKTLQRRGMERIKVNHVSGDVSFETIDLDDSLAKAQQDIEDLGYTVKKSTIVSNDEFINKGKQRNKHVENFLFCLPFTLVLLSHMWLPFEWLHNPFVQLGLALPVYLAGMRYFGVSAWKNLRKGNFHMNVLIALGATAAFGYSCAGLFSGHPGDYLFFETAASIITIVFFGNWLEQISIAKTQRQLKELAKSHPVMANMIAYDHEHNELIFPIENKDLKVGDLVLIRTGEEIPMDCKVLNGEAEVNEAIVTGESTPVSKKQGDMLIGGSVVSNGNLKAYVSAVGSQSIMGGIVAMMQDAQTHKPPVQQLADNISAIFVPVVLSIAALTVLGNIWLAHLDFAESLMRGIAVLVVSCPCAMGIATPAALAVGMGRAARNGILFARPESMELFGSIRQMVFDKTGTLTTGKFQISGFGVTGRMDEEEFKKLVFSLERMSNHPIARSIAGEWQQKEHIKWKMIGEIKGLGVKAIAKDGHSFMIGSAKILGPDAQPEHHLYVTRDEMPVGWIDIEDEIRAEAQSVIDFCKSNGIKTILLSGDIKKKCQEVAAKLGLDEVLAEQTPAQKLKEIERLCGIGPTAMVGDGVNDAPALAKATISISVSQASTLAVQSASVVLTNGGLTKLPASLLLGKATYGTVKTNLFWAFAYNLVAIPVAALGYLHPAFGALMMAGSDVVLALNSLWLGVKKLK